MYMVCVVCVYMVCTVCVYGVSECVWYVHLRTCVYVCVYGVCGVCVCVCDLLPLSPCAGSQDTEGSRAPASLPVALSHQHPAPQNSYSPFCSVVVLRVS